MKHSYYRAGVTAALSLAALAGRAQAPNWSLTTRLGVPQSSGSAQLYGMVADAGGNLLVTGTFRGQLALGSTTLTSVGGADWFVGKYAPGTSTWVWAQSGGGTGDDYAYDVAVSGGNVYVVGDFVNGTANDRGVLFGGTGPGSSTVVVRGATATSSVNLLLLKYQDNGSSAALRWAQTGGSEGSAYATDVAVSGTSVYVLGTYTQPGGSVGPLVLGGNGTTAGTTFVSGAASNGSGSADDVLLVKYTDNGATATLGWTQVAGCAGTDFSKDVVAQGNAVYVSAGTSAATGSQAAVLGGDGTTRGTAVQNGATGTNNFSSDLLLARYTDAGSTATFNWSQVAGGSSFDAPQGLAVSGTSVYVAGSITNSRTNAAGVLFGGSGTTLGTSPQYGVAATSSQDLVLAKYTDNGSSSTFRWSQVGGGSGDEYALGVAVNNGGVYVGGHLYNNAANANGGLLGGSGTVAGTTMVPGVATTVSADVLVARYQDAGGSATLSWAQTGGGAGYDEAIGLVFVGQGVYVAARTQLPAAFGSQSITGTTSDAVPALARLTDAALPTRTASLGTGLACHPNPAGRSGVATLSGAAPGAAVQVLDALGRVVAATTADVAGTAALAGLAPGFYLVRVPGGSVCLAVD